MILKFELIFIVGVAVCFRKYAPHLLLKKISGASAGALAATCLLLDMPLGELRHFKEYNVAKIKKIAIELEISAYRFLYL